MSGTGYTVEVTNLSSSASESDLHEFFSFSGPIEHIDLIRSGGYGSTAYVTFREPYALETAVLLSGLLLWISRFAYLAGDSLMSLLISGTGQLGNLMSLLISGTGQLGRPRRKWNIGSTNHASSTPLHRKLSQWLKMSLRRCWRGYILSKDALSKARAFDESYQITGSAAAKAAELSKRLGLTDRVSTGVGAIRSVDETYNVSGTTMTVASATGRTAVKVANGILTSSYFSAGAMMVSEALTRAAKAAENLAAHGRQN